MPSWVEKVNDTPAADEVTDALQQLFERALPPSLTCVSTVHLCELAGLPLNRGSARRIANAMKAMGWIPVRSPNIRPGIGRDGWRGSEGRGWVRVTVGRRKWVPGVTAFAMK